MKDYAAAFKRALSLEEFIRVVQADTRKIERRRAARRAFRFVEALLEQEQVEFHAGTLRDEILGAKPRKGKV